jgi:hypothetical protein
MTFQIAKSVIDGLPYNYTESVEAFRQAKLAHQFTGDVDPSAPAIIEQAVRRVPVEDEADDFVADYEVINDVTLDSRKQALVSLIRSKETLAAVCWSWSSCVRGMSPMKAEVSGIYSRSRRSAML